MSNAEKRLLGKNVFITGAGRGIGRAIALRFAREGANVAINDIDPEIGEKTAKDIEDLGVKSLFIPGDVSDKDIVVGMVEKYFEHFEQLDILVNNAGIGAHFIGLIHLKEEDWDRTIDINLKGVWLVTKYFVKKMKRNKAPRDQLRAKIINIASMGGIRGRAALGAYCASKFGVIGLTQTFARELGRSRITVNAICPGVIDTAIYGSISKEGLAGSSDPVCLKYKPVGDPEDVAKVAFFLASSDSDYTSGQCIGCSGGMVFI